MRYLGFPLLALSAIALLFGSPRAASPGDPPSLSPGAPSVPAAPSPEVPSPDSTEPLAPGDSVPAPKDSTEGEFPLAAGKGWNASLVLDNGTVGIWTVEAYQVWETTAPLEVVGLDDKGRLHVLAPYSGRWTDVQTVSDGKWLGGLDQADVDPRIPGAEIYTGSQSGNLYQVVAHQHGTYLDNRLIATFPGLEVHTIVAGDVDAANPGSELLVFTRPGWLFEVTPTGKDGTFETRRVGEVAGRVRDAQLLPAKPGSPRQIATVGHAGRLEILEMTKAGPSWTTVYQADTGMGRVAMKAGSTPASIVLYSTRDDGLVLRHERDASGAWRTETIYLGPLGPRGIAAGPFDDDPEVETIAVFGYSRKVEVLRRDGAGWNVATAFVDRDKGHWLAAVEVDGRNGTREILASGYGGRIVLLSRPPGYGLRGLATPR